MSPLKESYDLSKSRLSEAQYRIRNEPIIRRGGAWASLQEHFGVSPESLATANLRLTQGYLDVAFGIGEYLVSETLLICRNQKNGEFVLLEKLGKDEQAASETNPQAKPNLKISEVQLHYADLDRITRGDYKPTYQEPTSETLDDSGIIRATREAGFKVSFPSSITTKTAFLCYGYRDWKRPFFWSKALELGEFQPHAIIMPGEIKDEEIPITVSMHGVYDTMDLSLEVNAVRLVESIGLVKS